MDNRIGSGPIEKEFEKMMTDVAHAIDHFFNGPMLPKKVGFILLTFKLGESGRCNYISNANRDDVKVLLKEQLSYFEGMPEPKE